MKPISVNYNALFWCYDTGCLQVHTYTLPTARHRRGIVVTFESASGGAYLCGTSGTNQTLGVTVSYLLHWLCIISLYVRNSSSVLFSTIYVWVWSPLDVVFRIYVRHRNFYYTPNIVCATDYLREETYKSEYMLDLIWLMFLLDSMWLSMFRLVLRNH